MDNAEKQISAVLSQPESKEKKELIQLLKDFSATLRKIPLYPETHPMVREAVKKLHAGLGGFFARFGDLFLDALDDCFMVCGERLDDPGGSSKDLLADFKRTRIEGIVFKSGVRENEVAAFLRIMTFKPDVLEQKGGLKNILLERGVENIYLSEVKYARISEDETVEEKKSETPAGKKKEKNDIVGLVNDFLNGTDTELPNKEMIALEFKTHAKQVVRQLLKLVGPQKAVDEVIQIISSKFEDIGFSNEEASPLLETLRVETVKLREPKVTKRDLDKQVQALMTENAQLKEKLENVELLINEELEKRTAELIQENKRINRERKQINAVLRNVAEGLVIVDRDGNVLLLNPAAERLLGNKEQKVGTNILDGMTENHMISYTKDKQHEIEIEMAGGSEDAKRTLRASSAVIENEDGHPVGMVSVLSDITKQKEVSRMKDSFVSHVSHELRAPLISIQKSLSLFMEMGGEQMTGDMKQFLDIAANNATRLTYLVNDLLDVAKLEAGRMKPEFNPVEMGPLLEEVVQMLDGLAKSRGVRLERTAMGSIVLDADRKLLNQVFTNLIGNGLKFTPRDGTVTVSGTVREGIVRVTVADTGCGIPPESLEKIFEKFEQARTVPAGGAPKGTGLGLTIVRDIVELHAGKVWAESDGVAGSVFTVELPLKQELLDSRD